MSNGLFILAVLAILALFGAFLWFLGYNYNQSKRMVAERKAEAERMRAENEKRTTGIFAARRGSKSDVIDGL